MLGELFVGVIILVLIIWVMIRLCSQKTLFVVVDRHYAELHPGVYGYEYELEVANNLTVHDWGSCRTTIYGYFEIGDILWVN